MKRKATAVWNGTGKEGKGHLTTQSTILNQTQYSFGSRFDEGIGTNPEELIAAAHAGCFSMKLAFNLQAAGFSAEELKTNCVVVLEEGSITQSNLELTATVPNVTEEQFAELVKDAELNCPVSKVLNATVSVSYTLQN
ncbi:MAG: OsmC family protein [Flavobacterium sp.]|jgi:osmotically inducible protein OsmC|uniref:OsmC family protein n=1 Tax=Flavobacterium sp. TaxID=239 RepID=UPI0022CA03A8|nr:OsmC family protein [Flavobacterium sp.]MCZ8090293.1 OsmC family protein [Flavobacterium sp.]MCZ8331372.1 OsmC family protein [Flavobacterium sp.]